MPAPRRVVTGTDANGRSLVVEDGPVPNVFTIDVMPGLEFARVWSTDSAGVPTPSGADTEGDLYPPPAGARVHRMVIPSGFGAADADAPDPVARIAMHRTDSTDFGVVLEGELTLVLEDDSETLLRVGDLIVQTGTVHGWRNLGPDPVVVLWVMLGTPVSGNTAD